jgi:hypothetical protein
MCVVPFVSSAERFLLEKWGATAPLGTYVRPHYLPPTPLPPPKNRECQIRLNYTSFDADSDGDAGGTLCFRRRANLGRKTGVRRAVTYAAHVRALSS